MKPLVIYHSPCTDGFTAAWCFHNHDPEGFEFYEGVHGEPPPDVTGRKVYLVDFSYPLETILAMAEQAVEINIWDHHKSAQGVLADVERAARAMNLCPVYATFDMERSGAGLTWDMLNPGQPRPIMVDYVEDRDLWRFALPMSKAISANLFSHHYSFENWDRLMALSGVALVKFAHAGEAIQRKHMKDVQELIGQCRHDAVIAGVMVPVANMPYTMASDAAGLMAEGAPFAATYYDTPTHRVFSLRSRGSDGIDVSLIAQQYGGGGHRNAAGFRIPLSHTWMIEALRMTEAEHA